jgi:hypothetical protein
MDDWEYGHEACCFTCPNKRQCAKPDLTECNIGSDSHKRDPLKKISWNGKGPNVKCIFDIDKINTMDQIDQFKPLFTTITKKFEDDKDYDGYIWHVNTSNSAEADKIFEIKYFDNRRIKFPH